MMIISTPDSPQNNDILKGKRWSTTLIYVFYILPTLSICIMSWYWKETNSSNNLWYEQSLQSTKASHHSLPSQFIHPCASYPPQPNENYKQSNNYSISPTAQKSTKASLNSISPLHFLSISNNDHHDLFLHTSNIKLSSSSNSTLDPKNVVHPLLFTSSPFPLTPLLTTPTLPSFPFTLIKIKIKSL